MSSLSCALLLPPLLAAIARAAGLLRPAKDSEKPAGAAGWSPVACGCEAEPFAAIKSPSLMPACWGKRSAEECGLMHRQR